MTRAKTPIEISATGGGDRGFGENRPRILILAQNLPYPTYCGMDLRNWQNVNGLLALGEVGVLGLHANDPRRENCPPGLALWKATKDPALTYPRPKRTLQARAWLLDPEGHPSDIYYSDGAAAELDEIMLDFKPAVVILEELWLHRYIPLLRQHDCHLVLDLHNAETTRTEQMGAANVENDLRARVLGNILPERTKAAEALASRAVDQVWVCSNVDANHMREVHSPRTPIHVVPNTVDVDYFAQVQSGAFPPFDAPSLSKTTLILPGVFHWEPNATASQFLLERVLPRLSGIFPDRKALFVGAAPTAVMQAAAAQDPRTVVTGIVPDVRAYFAAATVMTVPLFQGGGTRLKILEGFASGIPVVSTAKGAEGLDVEDGVHFLRAETADEFVHAVERVWTDPRLAKQLARNGFEIVKQRYSWEAAGERIADVIDQLLLA